MAFNERRINEVIKEILHICDKVEDSGEPVELFLEAIAQIITEFTVIKGTEHAYNYVVHHARDASHNRVIVKKPPPKG